MKQPSIIRSMLIASLTLLAFALPLLAQGATSKNKPLITKRVEPQLTIAEVVKEDAQARNVAEGIVIPVRFILRGSGPVELKLAELEAKLITLNTDGKSTLVTKKYDKLVSYNQIAELMELPMAKDVFAKSFTLSFVAKFSDGSVEKILRFSKQGNFPVPSLVGKKK